MPTLAARTAALACSLAVAAALSGCDQVSAETKEQGGRALCFSAESTVANLRAGGAVSQAAAGVVRDTTEGGTKINDLAKKVAKDKANRAASASLADMVEKRCNSK